MHLAGGTRGGVCCIYTFGNAFRILGLISRKALFHTEEHYLMLLLGQRHASCPSSHPMIF